MSPLQVTAWGLLIGAVGGLLAWSRRQRALHAAERQRWEARWQESERRAEHTEKSLDRLRTLLFHLTSEVSFTPQSSTRLVWIERLLSAATAVAGCEQALFADVDTRSGMVTPVATRGVPPERVAAWSAMLGDDPVGKVAASNSTTLWPTADAAPSNFPFTAPSLLIPLHVDGRPLALLILAKPGSAVFGDDVRSRVDLLTRQALLILATFQAAGRVESSYSELVQVLARTIEARDMYTHHHSFRTQSLVRALGEAFNLPSQLIQQIEQGALLHDLGKIGIDDAILRKPGKLTAEEYTVMKRHPAIGYRILDAVPLLRPAAAIVLYHQEWFNGQGYPEGLAGEEIPLGARLVSVIDAWDAMTSNRPYRQAMPKSAAVAELRRAAGTQFDPKAVDAFLKVLDQLNRQGVATTEFAQAEPAPTDA